MSGRTAASSAATRRASGSRAHRPASVLPTALSASTRSPISSRSRLTASPAGSRSRSGVARRAARPARQGSRGWYAAPRTTGGEAAGDGPVRRSRRCRAPPVRAARPAGCGTRRPLVGVGGDVLVCDAERAQGSRRARRPRSPARVGGAAEVAVEGPAGEGVTDPMPRGHGERRLADPCGSREDADHRGSGGEQPVELPSSAAADEDVHVRGQLPGTRGRPARWIACGGSSAASPARICWCSRRSGGPGSTPSLSASTRRASANAASASACRPAPVQRQHQLAVEPLLQRVLPDERRQVRQRLVMAAKREHDVDPVRDRGLPQLVEPCSLDVAQGPGTPASEAPCHSPSAASSARAAAAGSSAVSRRASAMRRSSTSVSSMPGRRRSR